MARDWIVDPVPQGDLQFELLREQGVLVLHPRGELKSGDFERVACEIDPFVAEHGQFNGVVMIAAYFPGWDDLAAFAAHFRFIKEHRNKVKRPAVVTDDRLLSAIPHLASHLVVSKARHFSMREEGNARDRAGRG